MHVHVMCMYEAMWGTYMVWYLIRVCMQGGREEGGKEGGKEWRGQEMTHRETKEEKHHCTPCFENCSTPHSTGSTLSTWFSALINMAIKETTLLVEY